MATLKSNLVLSLQDQVTGRIGRIGKALQQFRAQTSRNFLAPINGTIGRMVALGGAYLGASAGMSGTISAARDQQAALTEIGIKADLTDGAINQLRVSMTKLAPRVNQTTAELLKGVDTMVTMGLSAEQAAAAMPAIGKTATATKSSIDDLSAASVSAMQNFKVAPGEIARMLDGMAEAGNQGAFEMRDMAAHFPALTASAASLGINGVDGILDMAAALQVARRGAGDAGTAANNMANFLQKLMSPEVAKRFKKFGVDTTKELQKAHKKGISPIEHFIQLVDEKTKGGQADLLGQLFGDKQVLEFVRPMLADFKDYLRIRSDAERASGTVADAYARRMEDANERVKAFRIRMENLGTSLGRYTLAPIGEAAKYLADVFDSLDRRVTVFHRLKAAGEGFIKGMGFESGSLSGAMKEIRDFIFGVENGSKAADQYGLIFKRFHEWGAAVRDFTDSVKDNPLVKFLGEMTGHGFKLFIASAGIGLLAGAVGKLAKAMWLLSGASAAVSILKLLGSVGGAVFGGLPGFPGGKAGGGKTPATSTPGGAASGGLLGALIRSIVTRVPQLAVGALTAYGTRRFVAETSRDNAADDVRAATHRGAESDSWAEYTLRRSEIADMLDDRVRIRNPRNDPPATGFWNAPAVQAIKGVWDAIKSLDARLAASTGLQANVPGTFPQTPASAPVPTARPEVPTGGIINQFLDGMRKLAPQSDLRPDIQSLRDAIHQPSGTQKVEVVNQQPPTIHLGGVTVYATTNAAPQEIADATAARVSAALESQFSNAAFA